MSLLRNLIQEILNQGIRDVDGWPRGELVVDDSLQALYHCSRKDLGERFTLTPRVPRAALFAGEEDFTTERVCMSPSLGKALKAISQHKGTTQEIHVYIADPRKYTVYRPWFDEYWPKGHNSEDREVRANALKGFVPDAQFTDEVWILEPVDVFLEQVLPIGFHAQ